MKNVTYRKSVIPPNRRGTEFFFFGNTHLFIRRSLLLFFILFILDVLYISSLHMSIFLDIFPLSTSCDLVCCITDNLTIRSHSLANFQKTAPAILLSFFCRTRSIGLGELSTRLIKGRPEIKMSLTSVSTHSKRIDLKTPKNIL